MNTRKIVFAILIAFVLAAACIPVYAHPTTLVNIFDNNGNTSIGSEEIGWKLNEMHHLNTTSIQFKFDDITNGGFDSTWKTKIRNGLSKWNYSPLSVGESPTANGTIVKNPNLNTLNKIYLSITINSNGHITAWTMEINPNKTITQREIARQLGYIIGLGSLSSSSNKNKIMYTGSDCTATTTNAQDRWGARVITGNHTTHNWQYNFKEYLHNGMGVHRHYCSQCGGFKTENCTYNSNNVCTKCGTPSGVSPDSGFDPGAAILPAWEERKRLLTGLVA